MLTRQVAIVSLIRSVSQKYHVPHPRTVRYAHTSVGVVATVFGSTGFTGRYLIELLANVGAQIIIPFRGETACFNHLKPIGEVGQIVPVRVDVRDQESIQRAVSRSNVVINLIGRQWETRNFKYDDVNHKAAKAIAEASRHVDRFIHVSAAGVSTNSDNKWSLSKAEGEEAVRNILPWATIMKPTVMFGDEDRLLNRFGVMMQYWPAIPVTAKEALVQPLEGPDLGRAIVAALGSSQSIGKTYVLGGPDVVSWENIISRVSDGTRRHKNIYELSLKNMLKLASVAQRFAIEPLLVPEEVEHYTHNIVVGEKDNTIQLLGVKPIPMELSLSRVSRAYRHPSLQSELIDAAPPVQRY